MRQIYTTPRHANIERMVALFSEHGIETRVTDLNAYRTRGYKRFSYARDKNPDTWPKLWIVHAADQTRARELIREVGIEPAAGHAHILEAARKASAAPKRGAFVSRTRILLLVSIGLLVLTILWRHFQQSP